MGHPRKASLSLVAALNSIPPDWALKVFFSSVDQIKWKHPTLQQVRFVEATFRTLDLDSVPKCFIIVGIDFRGLRFVEICCREVLTMRGAIANRATLLHSEWRRGCPQGGGGGTPVQGNKS